MTLPHPPDERLFVGIFPGGIVYADRLTMVAGDYKRLAFLRYDDLALAFEPDCPALFNQLILAHAADIQARRGELFTISECGQTVRLGGQSS